MPLKGTERLGKKIIVPGAEYISEKGCLPGQRAIVPVPPVDADRQSQQWAVTDAGVTSNDGGDGISVLDISSINSSLQGLAYTFPNDGATDDNSWTIDVALPAFMSATPRMTIRLFVLATGEGACGGQPPPGDEVFTGAKLAEAASQSVLNTTETAINWSTTPEFDTDSYFSAGSPTLLTIPTGLAGKFLLTARIVVGFDSGGAQMEFAIRQNGSQIALVEHFLEPSSYGTTIMCSTLVDAADGDAFDATLFHNGATLTLGSGSASTKPGSFEIGRWDKPA